MRKRPTGHLFVGSSWSLPRQILGRGWDSSPLRSSSCTCFRISLGLLSPWSSFQRRLESSVFSLVMLNSFQHLSWGSIFCLVFLTSNLYLLISAFQGAVLADSIERRDGPIGCPFSMIFVNVLFAIIYYRTCLPRKTQIACVIILPASGYVLVKAPRMDAILLSGFSSLLPGMKSDSIFNV